MRTVLAFLSIVGLTLAASPARAQCTRKAFGNGELMAGWMTLKTDGSVWFSEQSMETQLSLKARKVVELGNDVVDIGENDGESSTFCAIKSDRSLWCFGQNDKGQLGIGMVYYWDYAPHMVLADVKQVSNSAEYTCATKMDGTAWCWGENTYGQLGTGDTANHEMPTQVPGLTDVDVISAGFDHTCALKTNGQLWCWGDDTYGQVGTGRTLEGTPFHYDSPQEITGITGTIEQVSAGGFYTMAIVSGGQVWVWGANGHYHLALGGDTNDRSTPTSNSNLTNIAQVDAAVQGGCALTTGGQVKCWGRNQYGELGNGTTSTNDQSTPLDVPGMSNVRSVHSVDRSVCAVKNDDSLWCWGGGGFMDASAMATSPRMIDYCAYCEPADCSGTTPSCIDGACSACTDDDQCTDPTHPACALTTGVCRECNENIACTSGFCTDQTGGDCVECRDEYDCPTGMICDTTGSEPVCADPGGGGGGGGGGPGSSCACHVGRADTGVGALLLACAAMVLLVWLKRRR